MRTTESALQTQIKQVLRAGPYSAAQLVSALKISQPTLSRTIHQQIGVGAGAVTTFKVAGDRTPKYALLRPLLLGLNPSQRIYRLLGAGIFESFAEVEFLYGGATVERIGGLTRLYEGLPPYMAFAAPSGFLGRQIAREVARSHPFPGSLRDWGDDHRIAYLYTRGLNLPGNLVFGDAALQLEMDSRSARPTAKADTAAHYVAMAESVRVSAQDSSAGGDQPKFLATTEDSGHVIVKFAKAGSRMAELLALEHLALRSLAEVAVPASTTQLLCTGGYVFLEVQRFDREGRFGRVGMLSAGAVDDEFFGLRDTWSDFARRCEQAQYLSAVDAHHIHVLAAFSELIGNNDRHFENISMLIGEDGEYSRVAPAYDILPMRYAPLGGGLDPPLTPIEPKVGTIGAKPAVWALAFKAATKFWTAVQTEVLTVPVSEPMKKLAVTNLAAAQQFVAPLLPADRAG